MNYQTAIHAFAIFLGLLAAIGGLVLLGTNEPGSVSWVGFTLCATGGLSMGYGAAGISNTRRW